MEPTKVWGRYSIAGVYSRHEFRWSLWFLVIDSFNDGKSTLAPINEIVQLILWILRLAWLFPIPSFTTNWFLCCCHSIDLVNLNPYITIDREVLIVNHGWTLNSLIKMCCESWKHFHIWFDIKIVLNILAENSLF